jgi:hypothetical protein
MLEETMLRSRPVLTLVVGSGPKIVVCPRVLSKVIYAVMGIVTTTSETIAMTVDVGPLSMVVVRGFPFESTVVMVCISSNVEVDSKVVSLVLKLFDTVGAVIVVTMACVDTGTDGDAQDVEAWRRMKPSSDREENILAPRASVLMLLMR